MFAKHQVLGVANNRVITKPLTQHSPFVSAGKKSYELNADVYNTLAPLTSNNSGATSSSINFFAASNYQYYMTGIVPATPDMIDSSVMSLFYRDIYLYDAVGGCAVNIQSSFPFSDWELRGLENDQLKIYNDALERLSIRDLLPRISTAYLVDGFYAGSLIFDDQTRQFMDILSYDGLQCNIVASPFNNIDPEVTVHTSGMMQQFLSSHSQYVDKYLNQMPQGFIELLYNEKFVLDPISTLFLGRKCLLDRAYTSYLQALIPTYLIEKTLFRGTLTEAQRRQRSTSHITAGDDTWTPTSAELMALVQQFQMSENDPNGAWVATRNAIQVNDVRPAGDFWKWTDTADQLMSMKLRALGISEAFLSGDASYSSSESAYSTFIETVSAYREHLTNKIFYSKIFPLIAVVKGLYKEGAKNRCENTVDFLYNVTNRQDLLMPTLHWHKELESREEDSQFDMLQNLSELGVPIALKTWISAAGLDFEALVRDLKEDEDVREQLSQYMSKEAADEMGVEDDEYVDEDDYSTSKDSSNDGNQLAQQVQDQLSNASSKEEFDEIMENAKSELQALPEADQKSFGKDMQEFKKAFDEEAKSKSTEARLMPSLTATSSKSKINRNRTAILSYFKNAQPEEMSWTGADGKKHWSFNQERDRKDQNARLAKIAARMHKDINYRKTVAKNNAAKGIKLLDVFGKGK